MLDPRISLAFSVHSNPGAYALLLGSGISRSAHVPTGWEVVLDLIDRVAQLSGSETEGDPAGWYRERYGQEPSYSVLLEELAAEPAERQRLLRAYFEPDDDDRQQGRKMPTAAHRAIAELVRDGAVKVIVTTNFDRLLERALEEVGVVPTVLATADAVEGAMPLTHTQCAIVKVHGDYLDARIRNTPDELADYDARLDTLLDRIFDEYGLVVCGWSGEWDTALRAAIARCPTRRFTTYWATRGEPAPLARELIELRRAVLVEIDGADEFFTDLQGKVKSLEELDRPHPLSTALARATLKRYLADDSHRIRLHDLLSDEVARVERETTDDAFPPTGADVPSRGTMFARLGRYEAICETLMSMNAVAGYWGEPQHQPLLVRGIERLAARWLMADGGYTVWVALRQYPALLALYAAGLGASIAGRLDTLAHLFGHAELRQHNERRPLVFVAAPNDVVDGQLLQPESNERFHTPVNDHLERVLREPLREFAPVQEQWELEFDRFEYLFSIAFADFRAHNGEYRWAPVGTFGWRRRRWDDGGMFADIEAEARAAGDDWPFLRGPLFEGSLDRFLTMKAGLDRAVAELHW